MNTSLETLPDTLSDLRTLVISLMEERKVLTAAHEALQRRAEWLQEQINILLSKRFGRSSEKEVPDQPSLFDEAELDTAAHPDPGTEEKGDVVVAGHVRGKRGRKPLPAALPREEIIHDLPASEKVCGLDGHDLVEIGRETSEQLEIIPAQVKVIRHVRIKYGCPHCRTGVKLAPLPPQPIPKALATAATLAWVAVSKYVDALPLYRLENQFVRMGIDLPRATLSHWMVKSGILVQPLINLLRDRLFEYGVLQMDETPVQVLKEPDKPATSTSYMWVQRGGPPAGRVILFDYDPSRSGRVPLELLLGFKGWLQTDGYDGYLGIGAKPGVEHLACWAHARRKFDEAVKAAGKGGKTAKASRGIALIRKLFAFEKGIRDELPTVRYAVRQQEAPPILKEINDWMTSLLPSVVPSSALGRALAYLAGQWPRLIRYIEDGRLEIDNNGAENAIRPFVLGRKNWLFSHSVQGAKSSANLYSLVETAKANGLEPYAYLCHVFKHIPTAQIVDDFDALLPWNLNPDMSPKVKPEV